MHSDQPTAKFIARFLEKQTEGRPKSTVPLCMPCLSPRCVPNAHQNWLCNKCRVGLEFSRSDQYIYCDCGRCYYVDWAFRCPETSHGKVFTKFDEMELLAALNAIEPLDELNILILGRSGVGKSTWINAFVNYLLHPSLNDALEAEKLSWIIPFAFEVHKADENGEFSDLKVKVGFEQDGHAVKADSGKKIGIQEKDGTSGDSATQKTVVHKVQIGNQLVRLIDTPGIGDTRGAAKDKENLADILSVLRNYQNIHGILLLLKPDDQRLDVMFKFCIQELLTHLHRNAAANIAFGFTHTRGTNYMPGASFGPLRHLLGKFESIEIPLRTNNVYCFDSESFRFLAANKFHNTAIGHLEENKASWEYSVNESQRLLQHFKSLTPHQTTSTVNLYETRRRIVAMSSPMAAIAEAIRSSILVNEEDIEDLRKSEDRAEGLKRLLLIKVKTLCAQPMERPRTTCSHPDCAKMSTTGVMGMDGKEALKIAYSSLCHSPCYLQGVQLDLVGSERVRNCSAMRGTDFCQICGHHWQSHLHVNYVLEDGTKEIEDPDVRELIRNNANTHKQKTAAIEAKKWLIKELEAELSQIREAAAQFSVFLKRNAIMPYNDATLEYIDRCMDEETAKVQAGGSASKLENLQKFRQEYQEEVHVLEKFMEAGKDDKFLDQAGVNMLLKQLYLLKHYGGSLREINKIVNTTRHRANRERPYVMRAKSHWSTQSQNDSKGRVRQVLSRLTFGLWR